MFFLDELWDNAVPKHSGMSTKMRMKKKNYFENLLDHLMIQVLLILNYSIPLDGDLSLCASNLHQLKIRIELYCFYQEIFIFMLYNCLPFLFFKIWFRAFCFDFSNIEIFLVRKAPPRCRDLKTCRSSLAQISGFHHFSRSLFSLNRFVFAFFLRAWILHGPIFCFVFFVFLFIFV